jgi:type I restriction enzyme R subunit
VDRTDLDSQIAGTFKAADVANVVTTDSIKDLQTMLARDTRKIIVTTIFKFRDAPQNMNERDNIIVLADEAHRTQEGDLGRYLRGALPNAFLFGLTGTPINKSDKNTFATFGAPEDEAGYLSRYTYQDSLRDGATLPLHFEPRLVDVHIDKEEMDRLFAEFSQASALDDLEADKLSGRAAKMTIFVTAPDRVRKITTDIANHFKQKVEPHGFKAMVVTVDRHACVQYKLELDEHFPEAASRVIISTTASDKEEFKTRWGTTKAQQDKIVEEFKDAGSQVQFLVVTAKLLTGFDAPILQTMYLDKSLKDHTLLQAVTRANRRYPDKHFGRIVDYFGVFDDAAKALEFDEESVRGAVTNFNNLIPKLSPALDKSLSHFLGVDRTIIGFEGLEAAQEAIRGDEAKDAFAADFKQVAKLWESISPDPFLTKYEADYRSCSKVSQLAEFS